MPLKGDGSRDSVQDRESVIESDAIFSNPFSTNTRHRGSNSEKHLTPDFPDSHFFSSNQNFQHPCNL